MKTRAPVKLGSFLVSQEVGPEEIKVRVGVKRALTLQKQKAFGNHSHLDETGRGWSNCPVGRELAILSANPGLIPDISISI